MTRFVGLLAVGRALLLAAAGALISTAEPSLGPSTIGGFPTLKILTKDLFTAAVFVGFWTSYACFGLILRTAPKQRAHDIRSVLRLRYVVHPRRGTRVRNEQYERILERFNQRPTVTSFPG